MEILYYTLEVLCQAWPIILIMGMISIPILYIWFNEDSEYEPLDDYYVTSAREQIDKYNTKEPLIDPLDGHKQDICDN